MEGWAAMFEKNGQKLEVEIFGANPMDQVNAAKDRKESEGWKYTGVREIEGPTASMVTMGGRFGTN